MFDAPFLSHLQDVLRQISQNQAISKPGLYLIGTPIGNLADMTLRGLAALTSMDILFCEDTRVTQVLLKVYGIERKVQVYHTHNERQQTANILNLLKEGKSVGLVSDAGLPLISDPGSSLVKACIEENFSVQVIPGPSASLGALLISGLSTDHFSFIGFLPQQEKERSILLQKVQSWPSTLIFYEAPHRIVKTLEVLLKILGDRQGAVVRELTKKFEEVTRGSLSILLESYKGRSQVKGEITLIVEGDLVSTIENLDDIVPLLRQALQFLHVKEASTLISTLTGISKKQLYEQALRLQNETL